MEATSDRSHLTSFNPRSRAGSDSAYTSFVSATDGFNPRSRAGSDQDAVMYS